VKKEYDEKMRKRAEKRKEKKKEASGDKGKEKDDDKKDKEEEAKDQAEKDDKVSFCGLFRRLSCSFDSEIDPQFANNLSLDQSAGEEGGWEEWRL
jgi:hypothetical protein